VNSLNSRARLRYAEPVVHGAQRLRQPPIRAPGQLHEDGHQHGPDQRGVDENRERHADPQHFQKDDIPERVRGEREGENARGRRDKRTAFLQSSRDRFFQIPRPVVLLLDPREDEDLVVHRQAVGDAEHENRDARFDGTGGSEPEQAGQVAVLEHPHQRAEHDRQTEHVEHGGLEGDEQAAGHQEQQHERHQEDEHERRVTAKIKLTRNTK